MLKVLFFSLFLLCNNAFANNRDATFIVNNVPLYAKSTNAQDAKKIALREGQRKALKMLFKRGGIDDSYTKFISDDIISEMVESIKVEDEVITKDSYSSRVSILFNKTFLNFNLKKMGISSGKITNNMFLYIPVLKTSDGNTKVLDPNNLWYDTAYNEFFANEEKYKNIVLIDSYDLSNNALLNKNRPITYNSLSTLLSKYNSNTILVATAKYLPNKDIVEIEFEEFDAESTSKKILNFSNKNALSEADLMIEASKKTLEFLYNESQDRIVTAEKNGENTDKKSTNDYIDVFYVMPNISEYAYLLSLIDNLDFITSYEVIQFTTKIVNLRLHYNCNESELVPLLGNKGLSLSTKYRKNFIEYVGF